MTLSNDPNAKPAKPEKPGRREKPDQDIRHDPRYKTPWWRKPLKPFVFWIIVAVAAAVVVAAVILTISLGAPLF